MRKSLISLMLAVVVGGASAAQAVSISGTVTRGGAGFANVQMLAPKANCTISDALGNYACQVASGWSGTLAPYSNGWSFVIAGDPQKAAAATFTSIGADQSGINFTAAPAYGLRAELSLRRPSGSLYYLDTNYAISIDPF